MYCRVLNDHLVRGFRVQVVVGRRKLWGRGIHHQVGEDVQGTHGSIIHGSIIHGSIIHGSIIHGPGFESLGVRILE